MSERGANVVLLAPALVPRTPGVANTAEIEAQGGEAGPDAGTGDRHDDRILHVPAIERVGVADDDPRPGSGRQGQGGLKR